MAQVQQGKHVSFQIPSHLRTLHDANVSDNIDHHQVGLCDLQRLKHAQLCLIRVGPLGTLS